MHALAIIVLLFLLPEKGVITYRAFQCKYKAAIILIFVGVFSLKNICRKTSCIFQEFLKWSPPIRKSIYTPSIVFFSPKTFYMTLSSSSPPACKSSAFFLAFCLTFHIFCDLRSTIFSLIVSYITKRFFFCSTLCLTP